MSRSRGDGPLRAVVADDEELARRRIVGLLKDRSSVSVVGQAATGPATLRAVRELEPDLLFLDIQMPGLDGFEVLAELDPPERPVVVFSTAYDEYALNAFRVHAVDYLLKPFADERFDDALDRAEQALRSRRADALHERLRHLLGQVSGTSQKDDGDRYLRRFAVPEKGRRSVVDAGSVDWIEADGDYVTLHVGADTHLVRGTMVALERQLDPTRFLRIHRSAIVQLDRVRELRSDDHGDYEVVLRGGRRLRVGPTYRETTLRRLGVRW